MSRLADHWYSIIHSAARLEALRETEAWRAFKLGPEERRRHSSGRRIVTLPRTADDAETASRKQVLHELSGWTT